MCKEEAAFRGEYYQSIDPKGRIILPAKFREVLSQRYDQNLIITKHLDKCLMAFPVAEWIVKESELKRLPTGRRDVRMLKRFYMASASECSLDRQGRIVIPPSLKQFANLEKNVVIAGAIDHFEIWERELFCEFTGLDESIQDNEEMQAILNPLNF
jgi:MraZ protein